MKLKHFFSAMLALGSIAACNNKELNQVTVKEGIPTTATISVSVNKLGTRAPQTRAVSQVGEKEIQTIDIFIFDNAGTLETMVNLATTTPGDITNNGGNFSTKVINTTTGQKTIYAIANNNGKVNATNGMTLQVFEALSYEAATAGTGTDAPAITVAENEKFLMIGSVASVLAEKNANNPNEVSLNVTRSAAKAQTLFKDVKTSANFTPANTVVTFSDALTQLAQQQSKMFVTLGTRTSNGTCLAWTNALYNHDNLWIPARTNDFDVNNAGELTTPYEYSLYTPENVNAAGNVLMNNTTCMLIKVKATPTKFSSEDGAVEADGSFYVLAKFETAADATNQDPKKLDSYVGIYKTNAAAETAKNALAADKDKHAILKYTAGFSYYRINLRDMSKSTSAQRYSILRNNFYKVTITEINNIGWNDPEDIIDPDDDRPVETETSLKATITVVDWTDINMDESLS